MQYHQKQYPFYNPELIRMSMGSSDFTVNYVELLGESCVEFRHVHDDSYEIYYCLEGTQNFWVGNERLTLTGGMFLLLAPGIHHYSQALCGFRLQSLRRHCLPREVQVRRS